MFYQQSIWEKTGEKVGFVLSYCLSFGILFAILIFTQRMSLTWHNLITTALAVLGIVVVGLVVQRLLR